MTKERRANTRSRKTGRALNVLVVDDSAVVREVMNAVLSQEPGISVVVASDPIIAMEKMKRRRPDVILLDLEMPRMDGLNFLRKLMVDDPIAVVDCSGLYGHGTESSIRALAEGPSEDVAEPKIAVPGFLF